MLRRLRDCLAFRLNVANTWPLPAARTSGFAGARHYLRLLLSTPLERPVSAQNQCRRFKYVALRASMTVAATRVYIAALNTTFARVAFFSSPTIFLDEKYERALEAHRLMLHGHLTQRACI